MIKLTPKQIEQLHAAARTTEPLIDAAKRIGVSPVTVGKWRRKLNKEKGTKSGGKNNTHQLLAKLVRIQLDNDPEFLAEVIGMLDLKAIAKGGA